MHYATLVTMPMTAFNNAQRKMLADFCDYRLVGMEHGGREGSLAA